MDGERLQSGQGSSVCNPLSVMKRIGNRVSGKSPGGLLFGYFLLAAQEKVTCRGSATRFKCRYMSRSDTYRQVLPMSLDSRGGESPLSTVVIRRAATHVKYRR